MPLLTTRLLAATLAVSVGSLGCMGSFALTRGLYDFNDSLTGSKIVNNLVFWALVFVLPVYELALLGDALILNVIEFWTGTRLLGASDVTRDDKGNVKIVRGDETFEARPVGERRVEVWRTLPTEERVGAIELAANNDVVVEDARGAVAVVPAGVVAAIEPALR